MKKLLLLAIILSAGAAQANLQQPANHVDDPVIRVLAGEQRNGTVAIENLMTHATIGADESLFAPVGTGSSGGAERAATFSAASARTSSSPVLEQKDTSAGKSSVLSHIAPQTNGPKSPSVVSPVPEPETYALLGLGLVALMLRKKRV